MEVNLIDNYSSHIEFIGLPGAGKSTVSELLCQKLEERGVAVIRASSETGDSINPIVRKMKKLKRSVLYSISHLNQTKSISRIVKENGYKGLSKIRHINNLIQKYYYYDNNNHYVYVWDQGIIQAAISLSVSGNHSTNDILSQLDSIMLEKSTRICIYIKEPIETVLDRMDHRKTNNSIIEKTEDFNMSAN